MVAPDNLRGATDMGKRIRIASFNAENFAHPGVRFFNRDSEAPFDETLFAEKLDWMTRLIDEARMDLIGFQEVFSLEALQAIVTHPTAHSRYLSSFGELVSVPGSAERGVTVLCPGCALDPATGKPKNLKADAHGRPAVEGPHVGLVTRFPVLEYASIAEFPRELKFDIPLGQHDEEDPVVNLAIHRFERPVLKARVLLDAETNTTATVFVAHMKSKRGKYLKAEKDIRAAADSAAQAAGKPIQTAEDPVVEALASFRSLIVRAAEAVALRALILRTLDDVGDRPGEPVIVLGDLNDDTSSVTTGIIAGPSPPWYWSPQQKAPRRDVALTSVHDVMAERSLANVAYSHVYDGRYSIIDHIFVSRELLSAYADRVGSVQNVRIFNDHLVDDNLARPEKPAKIIVDGDRLTPPSTRSDHGIPVAEIEITGRIDRQDRNIS
ncbi:MAG: hypothetical protein JNM13_15935 [Hyphomicrobiaceae bacterium]|nr:hypothetical protein [Hyphomicrobiaceae bacterium]